MPGRAGSKRGSTAGGAPVGEMPDRLFAKDVAARMGVSVREAQYYLARWEAVHGPSVVGRVETASRGAAHRRVRRYVTPDAFTSVTGLGRRKLAEAILSVEGLDARITVLEDQVASLLRGAPVARRQRA